MAIPKVVTNRTRGMTPAEEREEMLRVMNRAARAAVREHKLLGNPIATWQDGKVVWLQPDEIVLPPEDQTDRNG